MIGIVVSVTVTNCVAVFTLPDASTIVQVTIVVPNGNAVGALLLTLATEQLSAVTGVPKATPVAAQPELAIVFTAAGAVIVGKVVSITVTNCVAVVIFPDASTTVHVTVVTPNGKAAGASFVKLTTEQLSNTTGLPNTNPTAVQPEFVVVLIAIGATINGATVSTIVTICVAVDTFPELSVTVHVTVVFPIGNTKGALLVTLTTEQLSVVTGVPNITFTAKHPMFAGQVIADGAVIVGFVASVTVTNCVAVAVFPEPSTTVHVTVVVPNANTAGASLLTLTTEQLSVVTAFPNTKPVVVQPVLVVVLIAIGATIVGNSLSSTVTTCVAVAVLPEPSTIVHVTVVVPNKNTAGASLLTLATEQLSAVTALPNTTAVAVQAVSVVTLTAAGAVIVGKVASLTVTNCVAVAVFPEPSTTVHVTVVLPIENEAGASLVTLTTEQLSAVTGVPNATLIA